MMSTSQQAMDELHELAREHGFYSWLETSPVEGSYPPVSELTAVGVIRPGAKFPSYICAFIGGLHGEDFRFAIDDVMDWLESAGKR